MENKKFCKFCGEEINKDSIVCPKCGRQLEVVKNKEVKTDDVNEKRQMQVQDNSIVYKTWFMVIMFIFFFPVGLFLMWKYHPEMKKNIKVIITIVFAILFLYTALNMDPDTDMNNQSNNNSSYSNSTSAKKIKVAVQDFSKMKKEDIKNWCDTNQVTCSFSEEYSNTVKKGEFSKQSVNANTTIYQGDNITIYYSLGKEPTIEQKNALKKAESYAQTLNMSKKRIYEQLTSEYGEGFDKDAAQYAIDNIQWDWNANALAKAKSYRDTMNMSKNRIYEQLISEYGENFTKSEAQYAIDHLDD